MDCFEEEIVARLSGEQNIAHFRFATFFYM